MRLKDCYLVSLENPPRQWTTLRPCHRAKLLLGIQTNQAIVAEIRKEIMIMMNISTAFRSFLLLYHGSSIIASPAYLLHRGV
jgi:hypothetical protein